MIRLRVKKLLDSPWTGTAHWYRQLCTFDNYAANFSRVVQLKHNFSIATFRKQRGITDKMHYSNCAVINSLLICMNKIKINIIKRDSSFNRFYFEEVFLSFNSVYWQTKIKYDYSDDLIPLKDVYCLFTLPQSYSNFRRAYPNRYWILQDAIILQWSITHIWTMYLLPLESHQPLFSKWDLLMQIVPMDLYRPNDVITS